MKVRVDPELIPPRPSVLQGHVLCLDVTSPLQLGGLGIDHWHLYEKPAWNGEEFNEFVGTPVATTSPPLTLVEAAQDATEVHRVATLQPHHAVPILDGVLRELDLLGKSALCLLPDLITLAVSVQILVVQPANDTVEPLRGLEDEV